MSSWKVGVLAGVALILTARPPIRRTDGGAHLRPLLPRPELLNSLGAGYRQLLADYYWVETLQAVSLANTPEEYRDIYDYAKMVAAVDPHFEAVYAFAGAVLPVQDRQKRWHNTEESTELLQEGVDRFPEKLTLRILLAYNLAMYEHQYARAAQNLMAASTLPEAPNYLPALATRLYSQAGQFDAGLALARSIRDATSDEKTRELFDERIKALELERILRSLDELLARYEQQTGHPAETLNELVRAGLLARLPADPLGGTLVIGPDGRSRSTAAHDRLELHSEDQP
jgi:hypothetical protein